jgi:hypothetical protein
VIPVLHGNTSVLEYIFTESTVRHHEGLHFLIVDSKLKLLVHVHHSFETAFVEYAPALLKEAVHWRSSGIIVLSSRRDASDKFGVAYEQLKRLFASTDIQVVDMILVTDNEIKSQLRSIRSSATTRC